MDAIHTIHRIEQMITAAVREEASGTLTITQCRLLVLIGALHLPSQTGLVALSGVDRSTMTQSLRLMEKGGLLKRARSKHDTRVMEITLTAAGRSKAELAKRAMRAAEEQVAARVKGLDKLRIVEPAAEKLVEQRAAA